ncbi:MAG: hypothetical protein K2Q20_10155, partial [Phycisphaerales bacterium]|nr:hypothetical protein [Phycisphaerales bacterium]
MPRSRRSAPLFAAAASLVVAAPGLAQSLTTVNINTAPYSVINGTGNSNPSTFARLGSGVVFSATDAVNGRELWYSDGTAAGTRMVADIGPTWQSSTPFSTTTLGSRVVFGAWDGTNLFLHSSDGTAAGTAKVLSASGPLALSTGAPIAAVNNIAFISAADGQLWRYDGTTLAP